MHAIQIQNGNLDNFTSHERSSLIVNSQLTGIRLLENRI